MAKITRATRTLYAFIAAAVLAASLVSPAAAAGKGKGNKGGGKKAAVHFSLEDRGVVREHYRTAGCPPGLAKKNNGCMPPGQAKKAWSVGAPLPPEVVFEPLPAELVVRLHPPPAGHEYVRVAGDILMLAAGSRMVVDAISDLSR